MSKHFSILFLHFGFIILCHLFCGCSSPTSNAFRRGLDTAPADCRIPIIRINLDSAECESIHRSRDERAEASLLLIECGDTLYDGDVRIKTRGNSSWLFEKKPYSLKFPKKQRFFHLDKSKSFVLMHNMIPYGGVLQNTIAFQLGKVLGLPSPQDAVFVRVYINEDYRGLYQLVNKVSVGVMGLNIYDLDDENKFLNSMDMGECPIYEKGELYHPGHRKGVNLPEESDDCTGGYLLEGVTRPSMYSKDASGFVSDVGSLVRIRKPEYASAKEVEYIADFFNRIETAVRSSDGVDPLSGKDWEEYVDKASFARYYLVQEVMQNGDAGMNSFFMYKDIDEVSDKLFAGPIWDFDWFIPGHDQDLWACAKQSSNGNVISSGGMLYYLWQHEPFRKQAMTDYVRILYPAIHDMIESGYIDSLQNLLYDELLADSVRWSSPWNVSVNKSLADAKDRLLRRSEFLQQIWSEDSVNWVCVKMQGTVFPARDVYTYGKKDLGVHVRPLPVIEPTDPYSKYYDAMTGEELHLDTILYSDHVITVQQRFPPQWKILYRRIVRKIQKTMLNNNL